MDTAEKFDQIGARLRQTTVPRLDRLGRENPPVRLDVRNGRHGEEFRLDVREDVSAEVIDIQPSLRHLLLLCRDGRNKDRFLCGHDERHWFAAAVPGTSVRTVETAMEALKPPIVRQMQEQKPLRRKEQQKRHNSLYRRQGEWFFLPDKKLRVPADQVLHDEPLRQGQRKPHIAQHCWRTKGETVFVSPKFPTGTTTVPNSPEERKLGRWMTRNAEVWVKGRITHPDHATLVLNCWHRALPNTESLARGRQSLVFLD